MNVIRPPELAGYDGASLVFRKHPVIEVALKKRSAPSTSSGFQRFFSHFESVFFVLRVSVLLPYGRPLPRCARSWILPDGRRTDPIKLGRNKLHGTTSVKGIQNLGHFEPTFRSLISNRICDQEHPH